jgi:hypothetical protein
MKESNYQQLWSNVVTGNSYVIKATGDSLSIIKTDPLGNSRTTNTYGPETKNWEAASNLYRPITAKFDGYSQLPRPKISVTQSK